MIAHLHGILTLMRQDRVVVECGGVGYLVNVAAGTLARLPEIGATVRLPVYLSVSEHAMILYGFGDEEEKALFEELLGVSGVGPKVAQNVVTALPPRQLVEAIANGDERRLTSLPGVGKKLAQRIVVELAEQVGARGWTVAPPEGGAAISADVVEALTGLGFTMLEARRAARLAAQKVGDGAALEMVIKEALRLINEG